mgnify:CR=1 FL=1
MIYKNQVFSRPYSMTRIIRNHIIVAILLVSGAAEAAAKPRNLFHELLNKSEEETSRRIEAAWRQFREGDKKNQRLFFEQADGTAYIADVGNGDVRSEGMSYGMMISVQLDRHDDFDQLWKWVQRHMRHAEGPRRGYFAWQCTYDGKQIDSGSASDGEEWIAMALMFASHRWDTSEHRPYGDAAKELLTEMRTKPTQDGVTSIFDNDKYQVVFAPNPVANKLTDPSYHLPAFYELWAQWDSSADGRKFWAACAKKSREFFRKAAHSETGLMPEYSEFDGSPYRDTRFGEGKGDFRFDAWRTLSNVALDYAWWHADPWQVKQSHRVLRFLATQSPSPVNEYTLSGRRLSESPSSGLIAMAATAGLAAGSELATPFVQRLWDSPTPEGKWRYYNGLIHMLGLLQAGGRFQAIDKPTPKE